ncbi:MULTISPECIES: hypothetical protein [unclassified Crossiella]|uniref:hypothetical protein n=1 Tax=unclassified Crossiella TaxID=2620835 RepID=UPI002000053D|nr:MULTISPECIES: hypothetical protein [unclassified Crossiella]MCK2239249.1 hypothetical protein [Crossiella sp. S99.2]MCK2251182.1 hypothetical protein [Crossiella sp. S99.1]
MYELARVRLFSVGPAGARYQDVVLDLREVGALVPGQGRIGEYAARRPAPATVLFLENGGGKSVLIKLIFSVMLPGRRQVVGTTSTRVLEKFVSGKDVAHIALEWQHTVSGQWLVTGKVSEWRGHVQSADPGKLVDCWYSFRPTGSCTLDELPVTRDGRPMTLAGFRDQLHEAQRAEPELQLTWTTVHRDWTEHLTDLELDPELFRYQRTMNAGEGEAADAFTFKTDEAFVDRLLTAVTPEEDPKGLAEVVDGYAETLARRNEIIAERDFVAGALDLLGPLAAQEGDARAAEVMAFQTGQQAQRFAGAVSRRHDQERQRLNLLKETAKEAAEREQVADNEQRRLNAVVLELRRLLAWHLLRDAEAELKKIDEELAGARSRLRAWQATEIVLQFRTAEDKAAQLTELVEIQEEHAKPALDAMNRAARRLARGLLAAVTQAKADAEAAEATARGRTSEAEDQQEILGQAQSTVGRQQGVAKRAGEDLTAIRRLETTAVQDGLLAAGAEVPAAAQTAEEQAAAAEQAVLDAQQELKTLGNKRQAAAKVVRLVDGKVYQASRVAEAAAAAHDQAQQVQTALSGESRLAELLGAETVELDTDAPALTELLGAAIDEAQSTMDELRRVDTDDRRTLERLGTGGLLPEPAEVEAALQVLENAGIAGYSGWRFLAQLPAEGRGATMDKFPHLVDGIVLNDPADLARARAELEQARLLPRSIIAVGATAALRDQHAAGPAGLAFLVPPNPAMYDEDAAAAERAAITDRRRIHQARLIALGSLLKQDRELLERVARWQREYPPGTLRELAEHREAKDTELAVAEEEQERAQRDAAAADKAETDTRDGLPQLRTEQQRRHDIAAKLRVLATHCARIPELTAQAEAATEAAKQAQLQADAAKAAATRLRGAATEASLQAGGHRRTANAAMEELGKVPGGGSVTEQEPVPAEPVPQLRAAYRDAALAYEQVEVGADLRAALKSAQDGEAGARRAVRELPTDIATEAGQLLSTSDGMDAAARAEATARAERQVATVSLRRDEIQERLGALKSDYEKFQRQERSLEPYGQPRDAEHGRELLARANADWDLARAAHEEIRARRQELDGDVDRTKALAEGFHAVADSLGEHLDDAEEDGDPFPGSVEDARTRRDRVRSDLKEAKDIHQQAVQAVRRTADRLAGYAVEARFEGVRSPVRQQLVAVPRDRLPEHAEEWAQALRPRLRTLVDEIEQITQHRAGIVIRLKGMVDGALRTLRLAQRLSRLPDGLGGWSGQEFLRIRFEEAEEPVLLDRLGEVVDTFAGDAGPAQRDGVSLLLRGVRVAMPKGVRVEMLKPDAVLRTERLRVAEIKDVFSGGQQLTAAIILYCTMAALRANDRGHGRQRHSGVLFLDNPLGRANAGYLLELQFAVAAALGVQLVYTTGLFDTGALSEFPLIIRLRNDADLRAGRKYLTVESRIAAALDQLDAPDGTARLTATRLFHRPADDPAPS